MTEGQPVIKASGVQGIVITMDWVRMPDGRSYLGFQGLVHILSAEDAVGFTPTGHNSANWFARIVGPKSAVNLMGCQVRAVLEGECLDANTDIYAVP